MLPLLPPLCRQTTTMYGRPEGSVCLRAFDNSIIPFRSIDLRAVWFFWSIPASFSTIHWSAKIFEGLEGYRVPAIAPRHVKKNVPHVRRTLAWPFPIHSRLSPSILRTTTESGTLGWEWTARLFLIVTFHGRLDWFCRREKRTSELNLPASRCDTPGVNCSRTKPKSVIGISRELIYDVRFIRALSGRARDSSCALGN